MCSNKKWKNKMYGKLHINIFCIYLIFIATCTLRQPKGWRNENSLREGRNFLLWCYRLFKSDLFCRNKKTVLKTCAKRYVKRRQCKVFSVSLSIPKKLHRLRLFSRDVCPYVYKLLETLSSAHSKRGVVNCQTSKCL